MKAEDLSKLAILAGILTTIIGHINTKMQNEMIIEESAKKAVEIIKEETTKETEED